MNESTEAEASIRAACEAGELGRATTLVVEHYGTDIMAFLLARFGTRSAVAEEVFSMFAEKLWIGLPGFEWRCSMRSWAYRLARNAANDFTKAAGNRLERNLALSEHAPASALADRVRTTTEAYRRTAPKDRMRELRKLLPSADQMLLVLRVDRNMDWRELAMLLEEDGDPLDADMLDREAARLRKRFERVKQHLRELAVADGLL